MTRHADRGGRLHKRAATARALWYAQLSTRLIGLDIFASPSPGIASGTAPFWAIQQSQVSDNLVVDPERERGAQPSS